MPTTVNNEASTNYQFEGAPSSDTATSNVSSIVLEDNSGLNIVKSATPSTYAAGDIIAYTVTITNNSSSFLTGVRIIDNLGGNNLAFVTGSASVNTLSTTYPVSPVATNPLTFTLQELNPGQTLTLSYRSQVIFDLPASVESITNNVQGIGYTSTGTINGFASATIVKKNSVGELTISKSASMSSVLPNQTFNYIITLTNNSATLANVNSITDQLPAGFSLQSATIKVGSASPVTLTVSDYTLSGGNLLTVSKVGGNTITVPAGQNTVLTLTGSLS